MHPPSPSPLLRFGVRAAMVSSVVHLTGGFSNTGDLATILAWHPEGEEWEEVGAMEGPRSEHAVTGVSEEVLQGYCGQ